MSKLKKRKYILGILIIVLLIGIIGLFSFGKVDKYKGLVKVKNVESKLLSSVGNTVLTTSKGTELVDYNLKYTLDEVEGLEKRDVIIKGTLNSEYAIFKEINKTNVTSTLSQDGKEIEIEVRDVTLGEEQSLDIKVQITNAPNNENIKPEISIKEKTGEYTSVNTQNIKVETNSVEGIVYDQNKLPVSNIELSINKNGTEVKRTYTKENGTFIFSDLEEGTYEVEVEEEIYELVEKKETSESNTKLELEVREVDKFNIETHKYIEKLDLVVNGKKESYTYKDAEEVVQNIKNAKTISGSIEYKIVVKNNSDKETKIERVTDKPGEGLEFKESKNTGWKKDGEIIKYEPIEGSLLRGKEKREVKIVLDITNTKEIKTYINKLNTKGEINEKVVFVIDGRVVREVSVIEGDKVEKPNFGIDNLDGWYTDENYTNKYKFSNEVNKDLILYAKTEGEENKYTVNFIDKGEVIKTEEVTEGEKVTEPENPSKEGYTFKCWVTEGECFDFDTTITKDIDLTSSYEVIEYQISYDLAGGSGTNPSTYTIESETFTLNSPSKRGYNFIGWTGSNGNTPSSVTIETGSKGNKSYTANYEVIEYQISYNLNGGHFKEGEEGPSNYTVESNNITLTEPEKTGYEFIGWTGTGLSEPTKEVTIESGSIENRSYEANYRKIEYTITYNLDGGSATNPGTYTIESEAITLNNPSKTGYTFTGWTGTGLENKTLTVTVPTGSTGNREYTANYEINRYQLVIDPKGGEYQGDLIVNEDYGSIVSISEPSKTGYTFTGWTLTGQGTYNNGIYTFGEGNGKLEANYTLNTYNVSYDYTSCNLTEEEISELNNKGSYTVEDSNFALHNPNKYGYDFEGWTGTDLNEKTINVTVETNKAKDLSYVANCKLHKFTVRFEDEGSLLEEKEVEYNKKVSKIEDPEKLGYTFIYWTLNSSEYDFDSKVTSNITLTSSYQINEYTITYKGITEEERSSLNNPSSYTIETNTFTLNNPSDRLDEDEGGEVFVGWKEKNETTPSMSVSLPDSNNLGNKEYTAVFNEKEPNVYNIAYNLNGGSLEEANPGTYKKSELPITLHNPEKTGYTFTGWTGSNGSTPSNVTIPKNTQEI